MVNEVRGKARKMLRGLERFLNRWLSSRKATVMKISNYIGSDKHDDDDNDDECSSGGWFGAAANDEENDNDNDFSFSISLRLLSLLSL